MKYVRWFFIVILISSLTSFAEKEKPAEGLNLGDVAPGFEKLRGQYVLLSFWASYDAQSRMLNASLNNALQSVSQPVRMVSVSFDKYESIFQETVRKDKITTPMCFAETKGRKSKLYKMYALDRGFTNYLLDDNGIIVARDLSADELTAYFD